MSCAAATLWGAGSGTLRLVAGVRLARGSTSLAWYPTSASSALGVGLDRPLAPDYSTVHVALRVRGAPESLAGRRRAIASEVEPTLRVHDVMALDRVGADQWLESQYLSRLVAVLSDAARNVNFVPVASTVVALRQDRHG